MDHCRVHQMECQHPNVSVTYVHPHGDIVGVVISDLRDSPPDSTRHVMTLKDVRCDDCGVSISRPEIAFRSKSGGDLHDPRFKFA